MGYWNIESQYEKMNSINLRTRELLKLNEFNEFNGCIYVSTSYSILS